MIEQKNFTWDASGVVDAVHELLNERNTLFEDLIWEYEHNPKQKTVRPTGNKIFGTRIQNYLALQQRLQEILNRSARNYHLTAGYLVSSSSISPSNLECMT